MGQDGSERPGSIVSVDGFDIDRQEVTVRRFAEFVAATGYRTSAEVAGEGAVFKLAPSPASDGLASWWSLVKGANWRFPQGPHAPPAEHDHPVVQVTLADARAYARWAGRRLPAEAEWERAARGGETAPLSPVQWSHDANGRPTANTWQGLFPYENLETDGYAGVAPVGCFPANGFGVQEMIGNVWEWTEARAGNGRAMVKGGSYLCSFNFCANFKPAARLAQEADLPTSHIGFRTVQGS